MEIRRHRVRAPEVAFRRAPMLARHARLLRDKFSRGLRASRGAGRRRLVQALVKATELRYAEARRIVRALEARHWVEYDADASRWQIA